MVRTRRRESFFVLQGELTFEIHDDAGSHRFPAGPGDAVSVPRGVGHGCKSTGCCRGAVGVGAALKGTLNSVKAAGFAIPAAHA